MHSNNNINNNFNNLWSYAIKERKQAINVLKDPYNLIDLWNENHL